MTDIRIVWDAANNRGDFDLLANDLATGNDLETAILLSVFTDRVARPDDAILDASGDPRGWWGDLGQDVPIGSRLWLLERAKQTDETLRRAKGYIAEAVKWLVDDGVAAKVDVFTEWTRPGLLGARVILHRADGTTVPIAFSWAWQDIAAA